MVSRIGGWDFGNAGVFNSLAASQANIATFTSTVLEPVEP